MNVHAAQSVLFDDAPGVFPAPPDEATTALAAEFDKRWEGRWHLGTSSWHFPGWAGHVWRQAYPAAALSRAGLEAYARHPLLRTVSLDRAFYRSLDADTFRALARQTPPGFRFVVKAPAAVTDALLRQDGRALGPNPHFLDPDLALAAAVRPAVEGLGDRLGVLVFQLSPLPPGWLAPGALQARLDALWPRVCAALPTPALAALELRDASLLGPVLADHLKGHGVRYVLGLHDRMPPVDEQLPMLRALWPGDLVCRWNLQRGQRYADARDAWAPFDRLAAPDPATRQALARVARATLDAGHRVFVTINNKAEGCAPISVKELASAMA